MGILDANFDSDDDDDKFVVLSYTLNEIKNVVKEYNEIVYNTTSPSDWEALAWRVVDGIKRIWEDNADIGLADALRNTIENL